MRIKNTFDHDGYDGCGGVILYIAKGYNGYDIYNFALIYLIGRWIALYAKGNSKKQGRQSVMFLLFSAAITFGLELWWLSKEHDVNDKTIYAYCTPWIIASSISLFLVFKNIAIKKNWIYFVSPSFFSVYLFHENGLIKQIIYIQPLRQIVSIIPSDFMSYMVMIIYCLILFVLIILFDRYVRIPIQKSIMLALSNVRVFKIIDSKLMRLNE